MIRYAFWTVLATLPASSPEDLAYRAVGDMATVMGTILREHVDGSDSDRLARAAIDGMLKELDPWSRRITKAEAAKADERTDAAWHCDLQEGVTQLRIQRFAAENPRAWFQKCPSLQDGGPLVVDLKGNKGGYLEGALSLADRLVKGGILLSEIHRRGEIQVHRARDIGYPPASILVLVDEETASAAELLAGILRDRASATLLGSQTRGKGSIQQPLRLGNGDVVLITTGRFKLPGGEVPDGRGLAPGGPLPKDAARLACEQANWTWQKQGCAKP